MVEASSEALETGRERLASLEGRAEREGRGLLAWRKEATCPGCLAVRRPGQGLDFGWSRCRQLWKR